MQKKAKIVLLSTGGTIAGFSPNALSTTAYKAGAIDPSELLKALPQLENFAQIHTQKIASIDSANITTALWLKLAKELNSKLKQDFDAVIITHGTDTMEESAYFLSLVIKSAKPVILVGAMRPASAISADGAKNLYNAFVLATDENAQNRGVMVTMNDKIYSAKGVAKTHTLNLDAFSSPNSATLGYIIDSQAYFYQQPNQSLESPFFDLSKIKKLPKVDILYTYADDGSSVAAKALFESGTKALIIAGSGAGSIHKKHKNTLKELMKKGLIVVVSSRINAGFISLNAEDEKAGFISAKGLNPQKARVLLMLALSKTKDIKEIRSYF